MTSTLFGRTLALAALSTLSGCHAHVTLKLPSPDASFEERVKSYQTLRPVRMHSTEVISVGLVNNSTRSMDYLKLGDGTYVYYPEDLLPVVPPNSVTARHIERSTSLRSTTVWLGLATVVAVVTGGVLGVTGFTHDPEPNKTMMWTGIGILGGGVVLGLVTQSVGRSSAEAAEDAYDTYDGTLQRELKVCVEPGCRRIVPTN